MEKNKTTRKRVSPSDPDTEEVYEDYTSEYTPQRTSGIAYVGIILAILLGAVIIGLSIIFSSGKIPGLGLANLGSNAANSVANPANSTDTSTATVNIPISPVYPMLGNANAPVTVVEFADFQCPFCKEFQDETFSQIKSKYIDTGIAKFYFVDFPFLGDESTAAAIAAECARQQGKFWEYHDLLYKSQGEENSGTFSATALKKFASQLGLNSTKFASCVADPTTADTVNQQFQLGKDSGVEATPTIFVNGKKDEGANTFAEYQGLIDAAQKGQ